MNRPVRLPWLTLALLALMEVFVGLQLLYPQIMPVLMRTPAMIDNGESWRFVTAWLVQTDGLIQIAVNTLALITIGGFAEQFWPRWLWALAYVAGGLTGEIAGYFWQPVGGGNSVAILGVAGLALAHLIDMKQLPRPVRIFWPTVGLAFALYLIVARDIHGPALLVGCAIGITGRQLHLSRRSAA